MEAAVAGEAGVPGEAGEGGHIRRRPLVWVAGVTAVVALVEAVVMVATAALLSSVVHGQHMSLAGIKPSAIALGGWVGCGAAAVFLLVCAVVLARTALRDRAPGRAGRILLIACAVVHGVLGAVSTGLLGWAVFAVMMVVLGLLVWVLLGYGQDARRGAPGPAGPSRPEAGEGHVQFKEKPAE
ncbi:hypothetical protein [Streptomyces sp. NRRL F-5126]|uniref:hypothetical protein n=1 Tax=Streptomyces sp. NRRL F-5126 TaxID=1463857 RepID=UPI001F1CB017|nr:hypothetical protein [Streptomyces sp. NRRL F-5126]